MKTESSKTKASKAQTAKAQAADAETTPVYSFDIVNNICALATKDMTHLGTFYGQVDAKQRVDDYFKATGNSPSNKKLVYGQLIGVAMLQQILDFINAANNTPGATKKFTGIRVYNAMSIRPTLPPPDNTILLPDVVLLPVYEDGTDIFTVHDAMGPIIALSGGMPCPNECGTGFYQV